MSKREKAIDLLNDGLYDNEEVLNRIFDDIDSEICENCHYSVDCSIQTQIMQTSFSCLECCDGEDYERYSSKPSCNLFKRKEE